MNRPSPSNKTQYYAYHYYLIRPLKNGSVNHHCGCVFLTYPINNNERYTDIIAYLCKKHKAPISECIISNISLLYSPA